VISSQSPLRLNVADLLGDRQEEFGTGNIRLSYAGKPDQVTAQLTLASEREHLSFSVEMGMASSAMSSRLVGILWRPSKEAGGFRGRYKCLRSARVGLSQRGQG